MERKKCLNPKLAVIYKNIDFYRRMVAASTTRSERMRYEKKLFNEMVCLKYWAKYFSSKVNSEVDSEIHETNVFTIKKLANYNGTNGKPAYIAVDGKVYDVSNQSIKDDCTLYAGKDLTLHFSKCSSRILNLIKSLPIVGVVS